MMRIPALASVLLTQVIRLCWVFGLDLLNKSLDFLLILKLLYVDSFLYTMFPAAELDELLWDDGAVVSRSTRLLFRDIS